MENHEFKAKAPEYRGNIGVSAWVSKTKDGKPYLRVKLDDGFCLFKSEPKPEPKPKEEIVL